MDDALRARLVDFLRPFFLDLDGVSRLDDAERIRRIAHRLYQPESAAEARFFELLLLFHGLGRWLDKVGNLSRLRLAIPEIEEIELRRVSAAIARAATPATPMEAAVAAALVIDRSGIFGVAEQLMKSRREGSTIRDIALRGLIVEEPPLWMPEIGRQMFRERANARRRFCIQLLEEMEGDGRGAIDQVRTTPERS